MQPDDLDRVILRGLLAGLALWSLIAVGLYLLWGRC
jgi:hypothetical protein